MKISIFFLALLQPAQGAYKAIYSGEEHDGSNGDAVIFAGEPDQAAGGSDLIVGCSTKGQCARTLLHFNVESLPKDAVITDVKMTLMPAASLTGDDPEMVLNVHRVTKEWSRTATSTPDGVRDEWPENLAGTTATTGDVTWKYTSYGSEEWDTPGGDFNSEVMTSASSVGPTGRSSVLFFDMTESFKDVVTGWIDGSIPNNGVLVKRDTEDVNDSRIRIFFHEVSGNKPHRSPKLLIVYTSDSQPAQMPTMPSGPGIILPGEPTSAPVTQAPTPARTCPLDPDDKDTTVFAGTSDQHASLFLGKGFLSQDKGAFGVGIVHSGEILRGLLRFNLDSIPSIATITCAEIILQTTGPCGPCKGIVDVEMYRVTSPWTTTGTNDFLQVDQPLLYQVELQGASANTEDVTWTYASYDATNPSNGISWSTPGGDIDPVLMSMEVDNERGQHKFPTSDAFVDAIQGMVDGTYENNGFLFKTDESEEYVAQKAEENSYKDYDTAYRLFHGEDAEDAGDLPILVVHYEVQVQNLCFSGKNTVEVMDGRGFIGIDSLKIGDYVRVQGDNFAKVYSFGHYEKNIVANYLQIHTRDTKHPLEISADHMLFVREGSRDKIVAASTLTVGDTLVTERGTSEISKIKNVRRSGSYAPFTTSGDIIVSGIIASNYISMISEKETVLGLPVSMQWIAHTFKAPHRFVCSINFRICENETYTNGLSNWIYVPYFAGKWVVKQNSAFKTTLLSSILLLPMLIGMISLRFVLTKFNNKSKEKVL